LDAPETSVLPLDDPRILDYLMYKSRIPIGCTRNSAFSLKYHIHLKHSYCLQIAQSSSAIHPYHLLAYSRFSSNTICLSERAILVQTPGLAIRRSPIGIAEIDCNAPIVRVSLRSVNDFSTESLEDFRDCFVGFICLCFVYCCFN